MNEAKYEVLINNVVEASYMTQHTAMLLLKALIDEFCLDKSVTLSIRKMARTKGER